MTHNSLLAILLIKNCIRALRTSLLYSLASRLNGLASSKNTIPVAPAVRMFCTKRPGMPSVVPPLMCPANRREAIRSLLMFRSPSRLAIHLAAGGPEFAHEHLFQARLPFRRGRSFSIWLTPARQTSQATSPSSSAQTLLGMFLRRIIHHHSLAFNSCPGNGLTVTRTQLFTGSPGNCL